MKNRFRPVISVAALVAIMAASVAVPALIQNRRGQGKGMPKYDPASEMTLKGVVEEVKQIPSPMGWEGTHLIVKADKETMEVHIGPSFYLKEQNFSFAKGDSVEVIGSKVKYEGADVVLAREVRKGDKTLNLRNGQGIPLWSNSRRK